MKRIIFFAILTIAFYGCKKDGIMHYEGENGIYFALPFASVNPTDSMVVSFATGGVTTKDTIIPIPVRVIGSVSNSPRAYKLVLEDSSTAKEGIHFGKISPTVVQPNTVYDTIFLKLNRTPEMLDESFVLYLTLKENENFITPMVSKVINASTGEIRRYTQMKVTVSDILRKPLRWFDGYLGAFSRSKANLMAQVLGITVKEISESSDLGQMQFWGRYMQLYLNDQRAAGNPVYEEDGETLMVMGQYVQ